MANLIAEGFAVRLQPEPALQGKPVDKFDESLRFETATLMRNTINAFLGGMGSSPLDQLNKCNNMDELRLHYKI